MKKNRIVFISNRREAISGNYEYIYDKLIDNKKLDIRTVFDTTEGYLTCFKYGYYMATAKVLLVDDYIELIYKLPRREDNYLIQVWHACGAFKTFGFSRLGRPGGQKQKNNAHRNYDFCTVSSSEICKYYAEGFGLSLEKVVPTGVPRTDVFFSKEYKEKARSEIYSKYPELKDKKVILFAPTFRGNGKKTGFYPENRFDFIKLYEHFKGEYVIIIKHHPFVNNRVEIPAEYEGKIIDMSENEELNELLFITDILITDYSSVVFEASLLDIPMLFYSFDLQNYIATRGFYYEYDSFVPGKIVYNMDSLIEAIDKKDFESEKIDAFKHKFFDELDGKAGKRVADLVAVICAGGIGSRMGNAEKPKQYLNVGGKPIILHTIEKFVVNEEFEKIIVLVPESWISYTKDIINKHLQGIEKVEVMAGGSDRNSTIMNAINYIEEKFGLDDDTIIVTHDAVRPFVTHRIIMDNIEAAVKVGACDTVIPATDTIVESLDGEKISSIPDRSKVYQGQTPQSFRAKRLKELYSSLTDEEKAILTDAAKIYLLKGEAVHLVRGEVFNIKITYPYDLTVAETLINTDRE